MRPRRPSIRRSTGINLVGALVPVAISLVTVPLYLDAIGQTRYGVLTVVWLLLGFFAVFDLGLGRATANRVARMREQPLERQIVVWTAVTFGAALGLLGAVCFFAVGRLFIGEALGLPAGLRAEALDGLPYVAGAVPCVVLLSVFVGALTGLERFLLVNVLEVGTVAAYQLLPLAVAHLVGTDLAWLLAAAAAAPVAGALVGLLVCASAVPLASGPRLDRSIAGGLARYGGWVTVTTITIPLLTIADRLVVGAVSGARAVTQYTVPVGLVSRLGVIPMSLARTLFPRFSGQPAAEAREVGGRAVAALVIVLTPLTALGAVVLEPFLRLWIGDSLAQTAAPIGEIALLGAWVNGLAFVPQTLLEGQGRPDLPAKLHLVELPPYVLGLWVGLSAGGLEGAAWVWTARAAVNAVLLFAAARLYPRWSELAASACAVSLACAGALTLFDDPVWRISLGTALVLLSLAAVWRSVPTELRALRRS